MISVKAFLCFLFFFILQRTAIPSRSYLILVPTYKQCTIFIANLSKYKLKQLIYIIKQRQKGVKVTKQTIKCIKNKKLSYLCIVRLRIITNKAVGRKHCWQLFKKKGLIMTIALLATTAFVVSTLVAAFDNKY